MSFVKSSGLIPRDLFRPLPRIARAEGVFLYDDRGTKILDAAGGAFAVSLGHKNPGLIQALGRQMESVDYVNALYWGSEVVEKLSAQLIARMPSHLDRVTFLNSGSEAVEAAVKLALQWQATRGEKARKKIIARTPSYHGNTLFALSASARAHYKDKFGSALIDVEHCLCPNPYRFDSSSRGSATEFYVKSFRESLDRVGAKNVAAFLVETVPISSAGLARAPEDYYKEIVQICQKEGILVIADEIACGAYRCGELSASAVEGLEADVVVMGKSLGGAVFPISALFCREKFIEDFRSAGDSLMHHQTFMQHPLGAAVALEFLKQVDEGELKKNIQKRGEQLHQGLVGLQGKFSQIGNVSSLGLATSVEFVQEPSTKKAFSRKHKVVEKIYQQAVDQGLYFWPHKGISDGVDGDLAVFCPPYNVSQEEVEMIVDLFSKSLETVKWPV